MSARDRDALPMIRVALAVQDIDDLITLRLSPSDAAALGLEPVHDLECFVSNRLREICAARITVRMTFTVHEDPPMYEYAKEKPKLFTEDGITMFIAIRDHTLKILNVAGACTLGSAIQGTKCGDTFVMQACIDLLVERGELFEIQRGTVAGQDRIFVRGANAR